MSTLDAARNERGSRNLRRRLNGAAVGCTDASEAESQLVQSSSSMSQQVVVDCHSHVSSVVMSSPSISLSRSRSFSPPSLSKRLKSCHVNFVHNAIDIRLSSPKSWFPSMSDFDSVPRCRSASPLSSSKRIKLLHDNLSCPVSIQLSSPKLESDLASPCMSPLPDRCQGFLTGGEDGGAVVFSAHDAPRQILCSVCVGECWCPQRWMFSRIACLTTPHCLRGSAILKSPSTCKPCRSPIRLKLFVTLQRLLIVIGNLMFSLCRSRCLRRSFRFRMCVASPGPFVCLGTTRAFLPSLCRVFLTCMKLLVLHYNWPRLHLRCRRLSNITFSRMARIFLPVSIKTVRNCWSISSSFQHISVKNYGMISFVILLLHIVQ